MSGFASISIQIQRTTETNPILCRGIEDASFRYTTTNVVTELYGRLHYNWCALLQQPDNSIFLTKSGFSLHIKKQKLFIYGYNKQISTIIRHEMIEEIVAIRFWN